MLENHPGLFSGIILCYNGPAAPSDGWKSVRWGLGRAPGICSICFGARGLILALRDRPCAPHPQLCCMSWAHSGMSILRMLPILLAEPVLLLEAQGFMDFLQQRPAGFSSVWSCAAGIFSELLPWISCAWAALSSHLESSSA